MIQKFITILYFTGIIHTVDELQEIQTSDNRNTKRQEIIISDEHNKQMRITMWHPWVKL